MAELIETSFLRPLAAQAAEAIFHLWDTRRGTFWRSTEHRTREEDKLAKLDFFPTVTFRSIEALLRMLEDFPDWAQPEVRHLAVDSCVPSLLARQENEFRSSLDPTAAPGILNPFTLSIYISTLARICEYFDCGDQLFQEAQARLQAAVGSLVDHPALKDYPARTGPEAHPFVIFHVVRCLSLCLRHLRSNELKEKAKGLTNNSIRGILEASQQLLARQTVGLLNPGGSVALAFCGACIALGGRDEQHPYAITALRTGLNAQDVSGCWPLGRIVPENKDIHISQLEIPTYEIAWAVAEGILSIVGKARNISQQTWTLDAVNRLVRAAYYAASSIVQLPVDQPPTRGWCSDHAYGKPIIESWTSATVLQSALSLQLLAEDANRSIALGTFSAVDPRDPNWPAWLRWATYKEENEPEQDARILGYLERRLINPILKSPGKVPKGKDRTCSVLLFGPPGTQKTTIVKAVAEGLGWPLLILSPGKFIERGLEYIEAQAQIVFDLLHKLSKVVVLFDECDELFRDREPVAGTEQIRGIAAFITASMLPKLQDLHDRGRVVFFVCTNHFGSMDPAIKRGGRVDHIVAVAPPDRAAVKRILRQALGGKNRTSFLELGIEELAARCERMTRPELELAARLLSSEMPNWGSEDDAKSAVQRLVERLKPALSITEAEYQVFLKEKRFSHPHLEKG